MSDTEKLAGTQVKKIVRYLNDRHQAKVFALEEQLAKAQKLHREQIAAIEKICPHKDSGSMFYATCEYCGLVDG